MIWLSRLAFAAACLGIPIVWGWLVHWAFEHWDRRGRGGSQTSNKWIDYQI